MKTSNQKILKDLESTRKELDMVNRKLKDVDVTKLIFIGIASHELKTPLTIIARPKDDFIVHEIRDTGIGIPKDKVERIFDEFYQVETGKYGRTGLGLAITKRLVKEHGGKIWVESQLGKGPTFYLTIARSTEKEDGSVLHA